jgi:anti-sigma regulatory factor (Ser/Thr protein kinase)
MERVAPQQHGGSIEHEAIFYEGNEGFLHDVASFIDEGVRANEAVLVAVGGGKIPALRAEVGRSADVDYVDIEKVGLNPARLIPLWQGFVDVHRDRGRGFRGIGEPVWPGRTPAELIECGRHEALLNLAFVSGPSWKLACPYDVTVLDAATLDEARRGHPAVSEDGEIAPSPSYRGLEEIAAPFDAALPEPPPGLPSLSFGERGLSRVRSAVAEVAGRHGLSPARSADLVVAVDEAAANSIRHGGGRGVLQAWFDGGRVVCEVRDEGRFGDVLAGRRTPAWDQRSGYGLWLANQVCDLVQIRSFATGSVVRLHMRLPH